MESELDDRRRTKYHRGGKEEGEGWNWASHKGGPKMGDQAEYKEGERATERHVGKAKITHRQLLIKLLPTHHSERIMLTIPSATL